MPQAQKLGDKQEDSTLEVMQFHTSPQNIDSNLKTMQNNFLVENGSPKNRDEEEKIDPLVSKKILNQIPEK